MPERTAELAPQNDITHESALLYETEKRAQEEAALSLERIGAEEFEDNGGEQAGETAQFDYEIHTQAVDESNAFGAANMDALHEAALKEAAQRVADIYETSEPPQENPDVGERAD